MTPKDDGKGAPPVKAKVSRREFLKSGYSRAVATLVLGAAAAGATQLTGCYDDYSDYSDYYSDYYSRSYSRSYSDYYVYYSNYYNYSR